MTFACTDCSTCGKCYDKNSVCPQGGEAILLTDDACSACGAPITDDMREVAIQAYKDMKKKEHDQSLELAAEAKQKREEQAKNRVKYPWED